MKDFLKNFRDRIEASWDEQTCSAKFLPIDKTNPAAGQCAPTSFVLLEELRSHYPERRFTHAIGRVMVNGKVAIDYHLWIVEITSESRDATIIDVTGDQSKVLPPILYEKLFTLIDQGVEYIACEMSETSNFLNASARQRCELLKKRYHGG